MKMKDGRGPGISAQTVFTTGKQPLRTFGFSAAEYAAMKVFHHVQMV
jgi:hypothetical protein